MNSQEAKLLHRLYYHREAILEFYPYGTEELYWAMYADRKFQWPMSTGELRTKSMLTKPLTNSLQFTRHAVEMAVVYLVEKKYIERDGLRLRVTVEGAEVAREMNTRIGRINIWFKNHKDGLFWLVGTSAVSFITSVFTSHYFK